MNWLFLRGKMERHKECAWKSLDECTDMWTHLFSGLVGENDFGRVLYSNGYRIKHYSINFWEEWVARFEYAASSEDPKVIVTRGGFKEYVPLLKRFPNVKKVYYGANHGCIPNDGIKYDLILCDSEKQVRKCQKCGLNGKLFIKPAAPHFKNQFIYKKYDVGFSAIHPKDYRKNVAWVYKTLPKNFNMLQMGHNCKHPGNVSIKYINAGSMVEEINRCKVIIAPYRGADSCPRIIPEALACGVPVVALDSCQFWREKYPVDVVSKKYFWHMVGERINSDNSAVEEVYKKELSMNVAVQYLKGLIDEICDI